MRIVFVGLVLLMLGLAAPVPARAMPMDDCGNTATIQSLQVCVQHAVEVGHINNQAVGLSLLAKLDAAQAAQRRGQLDVAVYLLEAFVREVRAQAGEHILEPHADHLLMHAQMVIQTLGG